MKISNLTAAALSAIMLTACVKNDTNAMFSTVRSTPMGPSHYMVSCVDSPRYCAQESARLCPNGFNVESNVTNPADFGRMTMTIKCD